VTTRDPLPPDGSPAFALLLDRYWAGECTATERAVLDQWMSEVPSRRAELAGVHAALERRAHDSAFDVDRAVSALRARVRSEQTGGAGTGPGARLRARWSPRAAGGDSSWAGRRALPFVAGAIAAGLVAGLVTRIHPPVTAARRGLEYATRAGQRETVTLSDGTRFTLAPESRLGLSGDYASGDRAVTLDGEAFFAVVHDSTHPFSVRAGSAVATDVGTAFDVRAYPGELAVRVAVVEGAVHVARGTADQSTLTARDEASVTERGIRVTHDGDVATAVAWTRGALAFHGAPLPEVVRALERWYDLEIVATGPGLLGQRVTIETTDDTPDRTLATLGAVLHARVERHGRQVRITPDRP
jgi:transmembrane sensor